MLQQKWSQGINAMAYDYFTRSVPATPWVSLCPYEYKPLGFWGLCAGAGWILLDFVGGSQLKISFVIVRQHRLPGGDPPQRVISKTAAGIVGGHHPPVLAEDQGAVGALPGGTAVAAGGMDEISKERSFSKHRAVPF